MYFRVTALAVSLFLAGCASSGVYRWVPFVPKKSGTPRQKVVKGSTYGPVTGPLVYGFEMRLATSPDPLRIPGTGSFEAKIILINRTKKTLNLQFADSREYEFELRDATGRRLVRWSDDQKVSEQPGYVIINPNERSEFSGTISTRDMVPGRSYDLVATMVGYDRLTASLPIVPVR